MRENLKEKFFKNLANFITILGMGAAIWLLMVAITDPGRLWLILFLSSLVGISDFLDGFIARHLKIESTLGGVLDRLRDKIFVCPMLIILAWHWPKTIGEILDTFTKTLIILIILIEGLLIIMGFIGLVKAIDARSNIYGRRKMLCQFLGIYLWLLSLTADKYLGLSFHYSISLIDLVMFLAAYLGIKSLEGYYQRYKAKGLRI